MDTLPLMLRAMSKEELLNYASSTPTYLDNCLAYAPTSIPLVDNNADSIINLLNSISTNNPLSSFGFASDEGHTPRGAFQIISIDGNTVAANADAQKTVTIIVNLSEPILLSPFTTLTNKRAMYGVTNLNFTMNLDTLCQRAWRKVAGTRWTGVGVTAAYANSQLVVEFLTPSADCILPQVNCQNYIDLPRFLTTFNSTIAPATVTTTATGQTYNANPTIISSSNIQLNQIPSRIFIACKKLQSSMSYSDPDSFLAIQKVSINWNNTSGLLASCDQKSLYNMSKEAGYNDTFTQWSGLGTQSLLGINTVSALGVANSPASLQQFNTSGSVLCLEMGRHVPIAETYFAPSSIGQFNLQFDLTVSNYSGTPQNVEIILMLQNDGIFVNNNGNSAVYTGVLSKQMVLDASLQQAVVHGDLERMIGRGSWWSKIKSGVSSALPMLKKVAEHALPEAKKYLEGRDGVAGLAHKALGMAGFGMSGGGESGGGMSGGKLKHRTY